MDKQIITFSANEQNLVRIGGEYHYSSNKVSYIGAHFDLGANWDGFDSVRAVWFTDCINGISTVLDGEGNCTVPTEVLKKKDRVFVNLVGSIVSNGELTDRLTTYPAVALVVDSNAKVDSTETAPVTPSQFEQFVAIVQDAVANIKDIVSTTLNADYTLTFVYSDGTSYTTPSIRGERGPQGADGADGTDGNGIASAVLNSNYTLTLTFTDGTSYTTPSIRGAQGPKGDPGDVSQAQLDAAVSDLKSDIEQIKSNVGDVTYTNYFNPSSVNEYDSSVSYEDIAIPAQSEAFRLWFNFEPTQLRVYYTNNTEYARYTSFTQSGNNYYIDVTGFGVDVNKLRIFIRIADISTGQLFLNQEPIEAYVPYGSHIIFNGQIFSSSDLDSYKENDMPVFDENGNFKNSRLALKADERHNVSLGNGNLVGATEFEYNTAFGESALKSVEHASGNDGSYNTAFGYGALENNTTGNHNTAIGLGASQSNRTGNNNTAVGEDALLSSNGNGNVVIGQRAMQAAPSGDFNVVIGHMAGYNAQGTPTGDKNTLIGYSTFPKDGNGSNNVVVGASSGASTGLNHCVVVGDNVIATKEAQMILGNSYTSETIIRGDSIIIMAINETKRKLIFNSDGSVSWTAV